MSIAVAVPIAIVKVLFKKSFLKPIGVIFSIGIFALNYFMILTNAALMGVSKSNEWTAAFISSWVTDTFVS